MTEDEFAKMFAGGKAGAVTFDADGNEHRHEMAPDEQARLVKAMFDIFFAERRKPST